jgi:hypothetical protein
MSYVGDMANIITGDKYGEQLCEALGIDTSKGKVARIVIDVRPDEPVRVYVELFGTDKLLDVQLPTSDVEIVMHG